MTRIIACLVIYFFQDLILVNVVFVLLSKVASLIIVVHWNLSPLQKALTTRNDACFDSVG